jgi:pyruvate dehydrogenase E2 component (dihydrolipoamide acetyltransferase)/2-oxoglutarate dehydrogenase E2 component (dihydrolipoamide succinyltransferase)
MLMLQEVKVPKRGMTNTPILVAEWKANEGESVEQGSEIVTLESEKITHTIEAEISGYLHIIVKEGQEVPIGTVIGIIAETMEELRKLKDYTNKTIDELTPKEEKNTGTELSKVDTTALSSSANIERIRISPVARRIARKHGITIESVSGTGPGGTIVREDIEKFINNKDKQQDISDLFYGRNVKETRPLNKMRKQIAEHMVRSLSIAAQVTLMGEIDLMEMKKVRQIFLDQEGILGNRITYTDLFIYLVAKQLRNHPIINSSIIGDEIKLWDSVNIGVATSLENGLIVPVIKDTDKKSLAELSKELKDLVKRAREGKLQSDDVTGGTFTITNLGAFSGTGYRFETVIINQPESAILGTGGISDRVVVRDEKIVIRPILTYYFTYDHRVIDGLDAAKFMGDVQKAFERPGLFVDNYN